MTSPNDNKDQNNLLYAIILSLLVLMGWQYFVAGPASQQEQARRDHAKQVAAQQKGEQPAGVPGVASTPAPNAAQSQNPTVTPAPLSRDEALKQSPRVAVRTPSLEGSIALKGGLIDDLVLVKYRETVDPNSAKVHLLSPANSADTYFVDYGWLGDAGSQTKVPGRDTVWTLETGDTLTPETPITMKWDNGAGLVFRRMISADQDYMFKVVDEIENKTSAEVSLHPYGRVFRYGHPKSTAYAVLHEGLIGVSGASGLQEITYATAVSNGAPKKIENVTGGWLGITDKYWAAALIPDQKEPYQVQYRSDKAPGDKPQDTFQSEFLRGALVVPPNTRKPVESHLYAGAKQASLIDAYAASLGILQFDRMIDWGWFYFITRPLFGLMELLNSMLKNFGLTILALTVIVKAAFYPIANRQYESMAKMKKLQPEMARIKEVYKDDTARQQKEMMEFYRKEKINPLAGCWPILLQIPVFFALYKVLFVTIDMRHAPFFGWIKDLSAPDPTSFVNLFGLLPFASPEFLQIGIWPVIMGITMWIQMQLNPPQPDPVQQQVFQWMPLMFTFLLGTFPAGLVIYWAWSNILSIIQQWYINKKNGAETHLLKNLQRTFAPILRLFGAKGEN